MSDKGKAEVARFSYDLVNLDFNSGLGYKAKGEEGKRLVAIKKLFERQKGHDFLLLLTINVRHGLENAFDKYLLGMKERSTDIDCHNMIDWFLERRKGESEFRIKAAVPSFIQVVAEQNSFTCHCYPPIFYVGHANARMIHFIFRLDSQTEFLKAWSQQNDHNLLSLPLIRCVNGEFSIVTSGLPGFDLTYCSECLNFLSEETRTATLELSGLFKAK